MSRTGHPGRRPGPGVEPHTPCHPPSSQAGPREPPSFPHEPGRTDIVIGRSGARGLVRRIGAVALGLTWATLAASGDEPGARPHIAIRGVYGGVPTQILDRGRALADYGINAVWI